MTALETPDKAAVATLPPLVHGVAVPVGEVLSGWKGISALTLAEAGVRQVNGAVEVPYMDELGVERKVKVFAPNGRCWYCPPGVGPMLYGLERIPGLQRRLHRMLWICEGESDALCMRDHCGMWRGHPLDIVAVPGAACWREEWARYTRGYAAVYCFPDGDDAGRRLAEDLGRTVSTAIRVYLPAGRDVRDVLLRDGAGALDRLLVEAEQVAVLHAAIRWSPTLGMAKQVLATLGSP